MVINRQSLIRIITFFSLVLLALPSVAASLMATVSSNQVTQAEVFQLRLSYDGKVDSDSVDFKSLESDFFMGQPSFSSSLNFINGKRSSRSEWTIALKARQLGTATIPSFNVEGSQSKPITIQVTQDTDLPAPEELVELHSQLEKNTLYPNETTQLKTRLVIKADARRLQNVNITPPSGTGFKIQLVGQANQYQTIINGIEATVVDQTFDVTAQQAPTHNLKSIGFEATIVFGNNRGGTTKLLPVHIAPESLAINVKSQPKNISSNWLPTANLTLEQVWFDAQNNPITDLNQPHQLSLGDSLTRELTLTIKGLSAEAFPKLTVNYPAEIRPYIEKPQFKTLDDGSTQMTIRQVLIAQQQGNVTLPAVSIDWFDTQNETEKQAQVKGLTLDIEAAQTAFVNPTVAPIQPKPPAEIIKTEAGFWPYLTALFALLWLATLGWHFWQQRQAPTTATTQIPTSLSTEQLLQAIKGNDIALTLHLAKQWLAEYRVKNEGLAQQIEYELQQLAAQRYRYDAINEPQLESRDKLIALIKQLHKAEATGQKTTQLPKL